MGHSWRNSGVRRLPPSSKLAPDKFIHLNHSLNTQTFCYDTWGAGKKQDRHNVAPVNWFNCKEKPTVTKHERPHTGTNSESDRALNEQLILFLPVATTRSHANAPTRGEHQSVKPWRHQFLFFVLFFAKIHDRRPTEQGKEKHKPKHKYIKICHWIHINNWGAWVHYLQRKCTNIYNNRDFVHIRAWGGDVTRCWAILILVTGRVSCWKCSVSLSQQASFSRSSLHGYNKMCTMHIWCRVSALQGSWGYGHVRIFGRQTSGFKSAELKVAFPRAPAELDEAERPVN